MLNELNSALELNELMKNKIKELEENLETLKKQNVYLKKDLIFMNTLKSFK
jgi:hypothetical protein